MRPFELILGILVILAGIIKLVPAIPEKYKDRLAPLLLIVVAAGQLLLEGFRWQLWPLFLAIAGLITLSLVQLEKKWRFTILGLSVFLAGISITAGD